MSFASRVSKLLNERLGIAVKPIPNYQFRENFVLQVRKRNEYIQVNPYEEGSQYYLSWAMPKELAEPYTPKTPIVEFDTDGLLLPVKTFMLVSDDQTHIAIPVGHLPTLLMTSKAWRRYLDEDQTLWHLVIDEATSKERISEGWVTESIRRFLGFQDIQVVFKVTGHEM